VENFKTWDVNYTAKLVSHSNINVALLHELIDKAMRSEAGSIGYLVSDSHTKLDQTGGADD
jgi:maltose-binding protein MalE